MSEKATLGMIGGVAGGGLFALTGAVVLGAPLAVAAAAASVPVALGGLSGTAVGARRETRGSAFFSGALAGFVGPSATAFFIGGELAAEATQTARQEESEALESSPPDESTCLEKTMPLVTDDASTA